VFVENGEEERRELRSLCGKSTIHYFTLGRSISWLSKGSNSSSEVWVGCKRLILKLFKVLLATEVKGPYMHTNQRLILVQK
jgi:hypothetical protein